jgi:hypothetical protein
VEKTARKGKACKAARAGQLEQDSLNGTARMGQEEQDCKDKTNRTGLPAQDCQHRAANRRQPGQDKKKRKAKKTARTGQLYRTGRSIRLEQDSQNWTSRTGQSR